MFVEPALVLMLNIPKIHVRPETIAQRPILSWATTRLAVCGHSGHAGRLRDAGAKRLGRDGADRHCVPRGAAAVPNAGRRNALQARVRADAAGIRRIACRVHPRFREGADAAVRAAIIRSCHVFDADCAADCRQRVHDDAAITR